MKKTFFITLGLLLLVVIGCQKKVQDNTDYKNYVIIGKEHNKLLSLFFEEKNKKQQLSDEEIFDKVLKPQIAKDFQEENVSIPNYKDIITSLSDYDLKNFEKLGTQLQLPQKNKEFLLAAGNIIEKQYFTPGLKDNLEELNKDIYHSDISSKELLYSTNYAAEYSNEFWYNYAKKEKKFSKKVDWKVVLAYDAAGAIIGASSGNAAIAVAFSVVASLAGYQAEQEK